MRLLGLANPRGWDRLPLRRCPEVEEHEPNGDQQQGKSRPHGELRRREAPVGLAVGALKLSIREDSPTLGAILHVAHLALNIEPSPAVERWPSVLRHELRVLEFTAKRERFGSST